VHRDIKPENILLHGGHALVADFGIALAAARSDGGSRMTETGMSLGTPHYMAPEQAMGEREITPKADIYALGMVLYVLSTGRGAAYFPELATTLVEGGEPADFFPLNTVILKACQPDPAQRYASASEMHRALQQARKALAAD